MKNILLLNGNPKPSSFSHHLSDTYEVAAREYATVRRFNVADMDFDPNLAHGYDQVQPLEACLSDFQSAITWADHIVLISPIWWGGLPGKLKGLIDRTFLPGFAFKFEGDQPEPIQLLKEKTARVVLTMDAPDSFAQEQAQPILQQLDRFTFQFCGISEAEVNLFGSVIMSDELQRDRWLKTVQDLGAECR